MANDKQNVVVLGASPKANRYSNQAVRLLVEHGHHVIPVHPAVETIWNSHRGGMHTRVAKNGAILKNPTN